MPFWGLREPVSSLTHLAAALAACVGAVPLWRESRSDRRKRWSMAIFIASMIALYTASGLYHAVDFRPSIQVRFRRLDHAAVFLLIAGTFTPFYMNAARGWWRWGNLILIWSVAFLGIAFKIAFINTPDAISSGLYVAMGWLALIGYLKLAEVLSHRVMVLTALGGVLYSMGAIVDAIQWPVPVPGIFGFHEVLHVLVISGSVVHYAVIARYVVPLDRRLVSAWAAEPSSATRLALRAGR